MNSTISRNHSIPLVHPENSPTIAVRGTILYAPTLPASFRNIPSSTSRTFRWNAARWTALIVVATAWQMLEGCVEAIVAVWARSLEWRSLRWATEERRAFSGGESIEVGDEWSAVRSGEGCPERERRISWSMAACYKISVTRCAVSNVLLTVLYLAAAWICPPGPELAKWRFPPIQSGTSIHNIVSMPAPSATSMKLRYCLNAVAFKYSKAVVLIVSRLPSPVKLGWRAESPMPHISMPPWNWQTS